MTPITERTSSLYRDIIDGKGNKDILYIFTYYPYILEIQEKLKDCEEFQLRCIDGYIVGYYEEKIKNSEAIEKGTDMKKIDMNNLDLKIVQY